MKCAVNYVRAKKRLSDNYEKILRYADQLQSLSMRENYRYGAQLMSEFDRKSGELIQYYIDRYAQENEPDEDYAVNGYYAIVRDLCGYGWDPEIHLWRKNVFEQYPPDTNSASVHKIWERRLVFAKGISFYVREMYAGSALYLRDERGFAEERLARAIHPARNGYLELMRQYMRCSAAGDREMSRLIAETDKKYNEMLEKVFKNKRKEG